MLTIFIARETLLNSEGALQTVAEVIPKEEASKIFGSHETEGSWCAAFPFRIVSSTVDKSLS